MTLLCSFRFILILTTGSLVCSSVLAQATEPPVCKPAPAPAACAPIVHKGKTKAAKTTKQAVTKKTAKKPVVLIMGKPKKVVKKEVVVAPPPPPPPVVVEPAPVPKEDRFFRNGSGMLSLSLAMDLNKQKTIGKHSFGGSAYISSHLGVGMKLAAEYMLTQRLSLFSQYYLDSVHFYDPSNSTTTFLLNQDSKLASKWEIGTRFRFNKYWYLSGTFGMKQDYVFTATTTSTGNMDSFWHGLLGLGVGYHMVESGRFSLDGETGMELYFPRNLSGGGKTSMGNTINTEIRAGLNYKHTVFSFFRAEFFKLRSNVFTDQYGYTLLFGLGFTANAKVN
jgi:hypothetical protein